MWVLVWTLMTAFGGERRITVHVEPNGEVREQKTSTDPARAFALAFCVLWALFWIAILINGMLQN